MPMLGFSSSALQGMSQTERDHMLLHAFEDSAETETIYLADLGCRLRDYELRYELLSDELDAALARGLIRETREVSQWVFLAKVKQHLARSART